MVGEVRWISSAPRSSWSTTSSPPTSGPASTSWLATSWAGRPLPRSTRAASPCHPCLIASGTPRYRASRTSSWRNTSWSPPSTSSPLSIADSSDGARAAAVESVSSASADGETIVRTPRRDGARTGSPHRSPGGRRVCRLSRWPRRAPRGRQLARLRTRAIPAPRRRPRARGRSMGRRLHRRGARGVGRSDRHRAELRQASGPRDRSAARGAGSAQRGRRPRTSSTPAHPQAAGGSARARAVARSPGAARQSAEGAQGAVVGPLEVVEHQQHGSRVALDSSRSVSRSSIWKSRSGPLTAGSGATRARRSSSSATRRRVGVVGASPRPSARANGPYGRALSVRSTRPIRNIAPSETTSAPRVRWRGSSCRYPLHPRR